MDRESLKVLLAQGFSVEQIARRFGKHASTVAYWMKKHGLEAPNREKHAAKGGIDREQLSALVAQGLTIAAISSEVGLSKTAVRHWLRRYELRTKNTRGRRRGRRSDHARGAGVAEVNKQCAHHGETEFTIEGRGYYRCKRCRVEAVARRRRKLKWLLVQEAGGACWICGYSRHLGALAFHHLDPAEKRLQISWNGVTQSLEALRGEAKKCALLCANCHAEVEAGLAVVPARVSGSERPQGLLTSSPIRGSSTGRANGC